MMMHAQTGPSTVPGPPNDPRVTLRSFADKLSAFLAMLITTGGDIVWVEGRTQEVDFVTLAPLIAGEFAASRQIANIVGDIDASDVCIHEYRRRNVLIAKAHPDYLLCAIADRETPLGLSRILTKEACLDLSRANLDISFHLPPAEMRTLSPDLQGDVSQALDSLWNP